MSEPEKKDIDWSNIIDNKIEEEQKLSTWTGISIWVILGIIGALYSKIIALIKNNGIDVLVNDDSFAFLFSLFLIEIVVLLVLSLYNLSEELKDLTVFIKLSRACYSILSFIILAVLILSYNSIINDINQELYLILAMIALIFSLIIQTKVVCNKLMIKLYYYYYKNRIQIVSVIVGIVGIIIWQLLMSVDFKIYTLKLGTDIFDFTIMCNVLFILLFVLINLLFKKIQIRKLYILKTQLTINKITEEKLEKTYFAYYIGKDIESYMDKASKNLVTTAKTVIEFDKKFTAMENIDEIVEEITETIKNMNDTVIDYFYVFSIAGRFENKKNLDFAYSQIKTLLETKRHSQYLKIGLKIIRKFPKLKNITQDIFFKVKNKDVLNEE